MSKLDNPSFNRRDFLKGIGLAGGGAFISLIGGRDIQEVEASAPSREIGAIPNPIVGPPPLANSFILEVSGIPLYESFERCTNLGSESEDVSQKDENDLFISHLPGRTRFLNIVLERALNTNIVMWDWLEAVTLGSNFRFNGSIFALDDVGTPIAQWNLINGWPLEIYTVLSRAGAEPYIPVMRERSVLAIEHLERIA